MSEYSLTLSSELLKQFVLFQFEIYRIVLSPLVNTSFFNLIFAYLSFLELGKRLEFSMGTAAFVWFCGGVALIANVGFLVISLLLYIVTGEQGFLLGSSSGIWLILFGAIAAECIQAQADVKRKFFFCEVPTRYYPLALFALFSLVGGGPSLAFAISMGLGYLFGQGRLDHVLRLRGSKAKEWEDGILSNFTSRPGWVYGHAALGSDAWIQLPSSDMGMVRSKWTVHLCLSILETRCLTFPNLRVRDRPCFDPAKYQSTVVVVHRRL